MPQLTWLITGCSTKTGFGSLAAETALARGDRVIATCRGSFERLQHLKDLGAAVLSLDISRKPAEIEAKAKEAVDTYGQIDVLFNNAGYFEAGIAEETLIERYTAQLQTNLYGQISLTQAILPHFRSRKSGTSIFNGSQYGVGGTPFVPAYAVSKFALEGFVTCLQQEVNPLGIRTLIIEPGVFRTEVLVNWKPNASKLPEYAGIAKAVPELVASLPGNEPGDTRKAVERVADIVHGQGLAAGRAFPPRLPLGSDGLECLRQRCQETLKICDEFEELIKSTDF